MPSAPEFAVALTRRAPATQPMPVCTIGTSMPNRSQIGVRIFMRLRPPALDLACDAATRSGPPDLPPGWSCVRHFLLAQTEGVDDLADPADLVVRRESR